MNKSDNILRFAERCTANRVYPLSIAQGFQSGDVICDDEREPKAVLFLHCAGFAHLSGDPGEAFLRRIYREYLLKEQDRRFVLVTGDQEVIRFFSGREGLTMGRRTEYRFDAEDAPRPAPCAYRIERISAANIGAIRGRIVPSFSWASDEQFLQNGFGFVAMDGERAAAVAFSAAVSATEVDIGVETAEDYRQQGLAKALAGRMCREILAMGKKPVWAHANTNTASRRTALSLGFTPDRETVTIRRREGET